MVSLLRAKCRQHPDGPYYRAGRRIASNRIADKNSRPLRRVSELVSGFTGTEVPRKGLRVRVPCPPLHRKAVGSIARRPYLLRSPESCAGKGARCWKRGQVPIAASGPEGAPHHWYLTPFPAFAYALRYYWPPFCRCPARHRLGLSPYF